MSYLLRGAICEVWGANSFWLWNMLSSALCICWKCFDKLKSNVPGQVLRPFCLIASGRNQMCRDACNGRGCMQVVAKV
jgi:hypothetical protein